MSENGQPSAGGAAVALAGAAFSFSLMSLFARLAGSTVPSLEIVFVRSLVTLGLTVFFLRRAGLVNWRGTLRFLLAMRGLVGFAALSCFFYSVTHLPLAEATVIQFTGPIFTALIAWAYLGERATGRIWFAIVLGLAGVLLIARPAVLFATAPASTLPAGVVLVGLAGAFLTGWAHVLVRRLAPHEHELVIILYFPLVATPASLVLAAPSWVWPDLAGWLLLLATGVAAQGGQIFLTRGMKHLTAAGASVILYLQIVFATVWGVVVLAERPDAWTLGGSMLVLAGTLVASRRPRLPA